MLNESAAPVLAPPPSTEPQAKAAGMALINSRDEAALKWFGVRIGYALGALLLQLLAVVMGLIDAMGAYLLGSYWKKFQWAVMGLAVMGIIAVLGSALSFVLWFV